MTRILKRIIASFLIALIITSNSSGILTNIGQGVQFDAIESEKVKEPEKQASQEGQFLEFYHVGETKKVDSSLLNCDGEIAYKSSNLEMASVSVDGTVKWLSGTEPVLITAYEKDNPDNKIEYFASFEGDDIDASENEDKNDVEVESISDQNIEDENRVDMKSNTTQEEVTDIDNEENNENSDLDNSNDIAEDLQEDDVNVEDINSNTNDVVTTQTDERGHDQIVKIIDEPFIGEIDNLEINLENISKTGVYAFELPMANMGIMTLSATPSFATPMVVQGVNFTAILKLDGTVWTTGDNSSGQLGDGTTTSRTTLGQVMGPGGSGFLTDVVQISAGQEFVIALKTDGTVWTWGKNDYAQLGDGGTSNSSYPKQVVGLLDGIKLAYVTAGPLQAGAIDENGYVYLWGHNNYGQLGTNNRTTPQKLPVQPFDFGLTTGEMQGVTEIALGVDHSVFLRDDGTVWTLGRNYAGEIGNTNQGVSTAANTGTLKTLQVMAPGTVVDQYLGIDTPRITSIAAGYYTSGAVDENGNVYMWGKASNGVLGQNNTTNQTRPVVVKDTDGVNNLSNVKKLKIHATSTEGTAIALTTNGKVYTWGNNNKGQLGDGTTTARNLPIQPLDAEGGAPKFDDAIDISVSNTHTTSAGYASSVLRADGTVWVFGNNDKGQLGLVDKENRTVPTQIHPHKMENIAGPLKLSVNGTASLNMKFISAFNVYGATQNPLAYTYESQDTNIATITGTLVTAKKAGWTSIKVTETNTGVIEYVPVYVTSNDIQPKIVQGIEFTAVLKADGTVWTVGNNNYGQLGNGTTTAREIFEQVKGENGVGYLTNVKDIAAGKGHVIAMKSDGTVWTWGYNEHGQLGDGSNTNNPYPKKVEGVLTRKNNKENNGRWT